MLRGIRLALYCSLARFWELGGPTPHPLRVQVTTVAQFELRAQIVQRLLFARLLLKLVKVVIVRFGSASGTGGTGALGSSAPHRMLCLIPSLVRF